MAYELTTCVTEGVENDSRADVLLKLWYERGWIQPFPTGELSRPIQPVAGRDGFECLVASDVRWNVLDLLATIHYTVIEGR